MDNTEYESRLWLVTMRLQLPCEIITTRLHHNKRQHHQPNSRIHISFMQPTVPYLQICPSISCCSEQQWHAFSSLIVKETALLAVRQPIFHMYSKIYVTHLKHSECPAEISLKKTFVRVFICSHFLSGDNFLQCFNTYLSRARCKWFAWGPADATASLTTHHLLLH